MGAGVGARGVAGAAGGGAAIAPAEHVAHVAAHAARDRADLAEILAGAIRALAASGELDALGLAVIARAVKVATGGGMRYDSPER